MYQLVGVFNKSDPGGAVRIVLNAEHFRSYTVLSPFEIDLAIILFVSAANVTRRKPSIIIAAAGLFLWLNKTFGRLPLRDLLESGERLKAKSRREWAIIL